MAARLLRRRLERPVDPLAVYGALTDDGTRHDTALFGSPDGICVLMDRAAIRAECCGNIVRIAALNPNGHALLDQVRDRLPGERLRQSTSMIEIAVRPASADDLEERLLAPAPLHAIRSLLAAARPPGKEPFAALAFGVIAFEHGAFGEVPHAPATADEFPDYIFWIADSLILFAPGSPPQLLCAAFGEDGDDRHYHDACRRLERLVATCQADARPVPLSPGPGVSPPAEPDLDDAQFEGLVERLKESIAAGEVFQIVPSRTFRLPCADPFRAFAALRQAEGNSYLFYVRGVGFSLFGASPETSVQVKRNQGALSVELRPIAGTRARGTTDDDDCRLEAELRLDDKELAEHMMLVDLARNDIARISLPGTCRVARLLDVERHARVMHLVSSVTGRLAIGLDAFDALIACLNAGTLSGAPKIRATELLLEAEHGRRGPYGGAVGWVNGAGLMDSAVVIRSALVQGGIASVRAGAGVVHDSIPQAEAEETRRKAEAMLAVLSAAEGAAA
jgi:anthranilate synthase component I